MNKLSRPINPDVMIDSIYKSLTKSEQKVAQIVKKYINESIYWSVTDLAERSDVGETTVIRFCRKLGYKGYQDFKLSLAQSDTMSTQKQYGEIEDSDTIDSLARKVTLSNTEAIQNTLKLIRANHMEAASQAIMEANKVYFYGVGASGFMAQQAHYRFMRLGFNVQSATDSHIIAMNCALAKKGDVVVGISTSGSTKDIVDSIEIAKETGAYIICITNHIKSPITKFAHVVLLTSAKESPLHGGAFSSLISQMHVLDILTRYIEIQQKEQSIEALQKTAKSVSDKLY